MNEVNRMPTRRRNLSLVAAVTIAASLIAASGATLADDATSKLI